MALQDILEVNQNRKQRKIGISIERIDAVKSVLRQYIAFWREYPDIFLDFLQKGGDYEKQVTFNLYFYQRVVLRVLMRYKNVYLTCGRGFSKSFLSVLVLALRAILYPGADISSVAGGKEQSSQILVEKMEDICKKIPAIAKEIDFSRGATKVSRDSCEYVFKNGSRITNLAATERSRGQRRHSVLIEECVGVDQTMLQDVIIPTMVVSRRCASGEVREDEVLNQSQIYITTSGYKNTFSYDKLIQLLVRMVTKPDRDSFVLGSSWRIPVLYGLQPKTFLQDLKNDSTFDIGSFEREYKAFVLFKFY